MFHVPRSFLEIFTAFAKFISVARCAALRSARIAFFAATADRTTSANFRKLWPEPIAAEAASVGLESW